MRITLIICIVLFSAIPAFATKTIHVFVALCDNEHQGIVPVPDRIGDGSNPSANLYWGCGYGVRSFFTHKSDEWEFAKKIDSVDFPILERVLFKHTTDVRQHLST